MYKQVCETVNELKERKLNLNKKLSNFDLIVSDIEHLIEDMKPSASEGYKIMMELQKVLKERRLVKKEMAEVDILIVHWNNIKMQFKTMDDKIIKTKTAMGKYNIRTTQGVEIFAKYSKSEIKGRGVICSQGK